MVDPILWEKILISCSFDRGLICGICEEEKELNMKKSNQTDGQVN